jgi:thiamine monophosphate synthase
MRLRKFTKANVVALGGIKINDFNLIKKINVNKIASISLFKR